jgi:hypothetical protein
LQGCIGVLERIGDQAMLPAAMLSETEPTAHRCIAGYVGHQTDDPQATA